MQNFKKSPNTLSFRTPRWRIKSARTKFIKSGNLDYNINMFNKFKQKPPAEKAKINRLTTHLNIKITGLVQGVGFRYHLQKAAEKNHILGFVKNQEDTSVYIEAEGGPKNLERFIKWCHIGPNSGRVDSVSISKAPLKKFSEFKIIR